jgi:hypothetical protein
MKIFFISPVRQATPESKKVCEKYVRELEEAGHEVHWPIRDTDQTDPVGIRICDTNLSKILEADEIHIWFLKTSTGIHFDLGATYILIRILGYKKKVVFVNKDEFSGEIDKLIESQRKDYLLVLDYLDKTTGGER